MKKTIFAIILATIMLAGCSAALPNSENRSRAYTDSLGRTVVLPEKIEKIAVTGPLTQIYVFPLCPELFVTFTTAFATNAEEYVPEEFISLPDIGQLYGGRGEMNLESLLAVAPDLVIDMGEAKAGMKEDFDRLEEMTGIPFVHIDATLTTAPSAYRELGALLGLESRSDALALWCEDALNDIMAIMEKVDADGERRTVLYCLGPKGLNVLASGSYHAQVMELVALNAAMGDTPVSLGDGNEIDGEQLLLWDPDVVLFQHDSVYNSISDSEVWEQLRAVKSDNFYEIPCGPYGWLAAPPAVQCFPGLLWLTSTLYPEYVDYDLFERVAEYYELFFNYNLTELRFYELTGKK